MSNLVNYAETELDIIGMNDSDEMNIMMRRHLLHMVKEFADEGHSGYSASYALSCLTRLLGFRPLSPLTGEDDEWTDVSEQSGRPLYQNKRYSAVFKEGEDGEAYDIQGKMFWEWIVGENNTKFKSYYTCKDSRVTVQFPYEVPDEPIYEYRESDA